MKNELEDNEEWVKEIFLKIQNAWNENDYESLINIESKLLYERDSEKIKKYIKDNKREVRKCININHIEIYDYYEDEYNKYLKAIMEVSLENYIYDISTGEVCSGTKDYIIDKIYKIILRKSGSEDEKKIKCEKCNAPINLFDARKCEYCGAILRINRFDWVVEEIETLDVKQGEDYNWIKIK